MKTLFLAAIPFGILSAALPDLIVWTVRAVIKTVFYLS